MSSRTFAGWLMVILVAWCVMPRAEAAPKGFWVFGDSLTSEYNSWASQLNNQGLAHIQNVAQAGSMMVGTNMPSQMSCLHREVIMWLGTNDAGAGINPGLFEVALRDNLSHLSNRNCKVWLVLPVKLYLSKGHENRTWRLRKVTATVSKDYPNVTLLDAPYDAEDTTDGIHPTESQATYTAAWFANRLGL